MLDTRETSEGRRQIWEIDGRKFLLPQALGISQLGKILAACERFGFESVVEMMSEGMSRIFQNGSIHLFLALMFREHPPSAKRNRLGGKSPFKGGLDEIAEREKFFAEADELGLIDPRMAAEAIGFFFEKLISVSTSSPEILFLMNPVIVKKAMKRKKHPLVAKNVTSPLNGTLPGKKAGKASSKKSSALPATATHLGVIHSKETISPSG